MVVSEEVSRPRAHALTCLRLYNVQQEENETADDCLLKIKEIIRESELDIPDPVIDRAHRVGTAYNNKPPAMIVKFTTSRHRTKLYRARKEIKERFGYSLQVDLAKEHLYILKKVREIGRENKETGFEFAYANVNCVLFMKIHGKFERFTSVEDATRLMGLVVQPGDVVDDGNHDDNNTGDVTVQSRRPIELVVCDGNSETSSSNDSHECVDDSYYGDDEHDSSEYIHPLQPVIMQQMTPVQHVQPVQMMQPVQHIQLVQQVQLIQPAGRMIQDPNRLQMVQEPGRLPVIQEVAHESCADSVARVVSGLVKEMKMFKKDMNEQRDKIGTSIQENDASGDKMNRVDGGKFKDIENKENIVKMQSESCSDNAVINNGA